jgi:ATP phosphoribosyltransferase regulatory subunit
MSASTLSPSPPLSPIIARRRAISLSALGVFAGWGYREMEVPLLDYFDPLRRALDRRQVNRMFRFVDRDGNLLVLRADVTPAIAKVYAYQLADAPLPLRVCYANKVVRIERAFTREQIESYQLGVELIGAPGLGPEVEVVLVAVETLRGLGARDFEIHLGDVVLAERLVELTRADRARREPLMSAIGDRDPHAVRALVADLSLPASLVAALVDLASLRFEADALDRLRRDAPADPVLALACDRLEALIATLADLGLGQHLHLDLGLTNEVGYYTGMTLRIVSERVGRVLGGGGRYDELIGRFGAATPAVGFSLNLEALMQVLEPTPLQDAELGAPQPVAVGPDLVAGFRRALDHRAQGAPTVIRHEPHRPQ